MTFNTSIKKLIAVPALIALIITVFLIYSLAGLTVSPLVYAKPPAFVEHYAAKLNNLGASFRKNKVESDVGNTEQSKTQKITTDFSNEEKLVREVILDGEPIEALLQLFVHPDKAQRVRVAAAFAEVNGNLTHDEESGFPKKRDQFWIDVKAHLPDIQNALYEALITSAEEGTTNYIPYTLAWMPGQDHKTVELLAWSALHHPAPWVRRFSVFFVVQFGNNEELASLLLQDRINDPDYGVRREVLDQKIRRFKDLFVAAS